MSSDKARDDELVVVFMLMLFLFLNGKKRKDFEGEKGRWLVRGKS